MLSIYTYLGIHLFQFLCWTGVGKSCKDERHDGWMILRLWPSRGRHPWWRTTRDNVDGKTKAERNILSLPPTSGRCKTWPELHFIEMLCILAVHTEIQYSVSMLRVFSPASVFHTFYRHIFHSYPMENIP